jgi:hypothetical protein
MIFGAALGLHLDETLARQEGVKIPAPVGAGILTLTPPRHFFIQYLVWSPGAAPQILRAGGWGSPGWMFLLSLVGRDRRWPGCSAT